MEYDEVTAETKSPANVIDLATWCESNYAKLDLRKQRFADAVLNHKIRQWSSMELKKAYGETF